MLCILRNIWPGFIIAFCLQHALSLSLLSPSFLSLSLSLSTAHFCCVSLSLASVCRFCRPCSTFIIFAIIFLLNNSTKSCSCNCSYKRNNCCSCSCGCGCNCNSHSQPVDLHSFWEETDFEICLSISEREAKGKGNKGTKKRRKTQERSYAKISIQQPVKSSLTAAASSSSS